MADNLIERAVKMNGREIVSDLVLTLLNGFLSLKFILDVSCSILRFGDLCIFKALGIDTNL